MERTTGELFRLRMGFKTVIYVNSREAVNEIFDRQPAKSCCKGRLVGGNDIAHGLRLALAPYGPRWRKFRALFHKVLMLKMSLTFEPSQEFRSQEAPL